MRIAPLLLLFAGCNSVLGIPEPMLISAGPDAQVGPKADAMPPPPDAAPPDAPPMFTLTINKAATGGTGSVMTDMTLACIDDCTTMSAPYTIGTAVNMEARPSPGSVFLGWEGACSGIYRFCSVTLDQDVTVGARFAPNDANVMFVTSQRVAADFGSVAAADMMCDRAAKSVGLSGTFISTVSKEGANFKDRLVVPGMGVQPRGFVRMDGLPIADTVDDLLIKHRLWYPIRFDENGSLTENFAWTGTDRDGTALMDKTCKGWTTRSASEMGVWGDPTGASGIMNTFWNQCDQQAGIECVQIDKRKEIATPPAVQGKLIWPTRARFSPGQGGLLAAKTLCDSEKPPSVAGTVRPLLPTTMVAASDLVSPDTMYVRADGIPIAKGSDLGTHKMMSGIWVFADGSYEPDSCCTWRGATAWTAKPTLDQNCMNWSSSLSSMHLTNSNFAIFGFWEGDYSPFDCSMAWPIFCVED